MRDYEGEEGGRRIREENDGQGDAEQWGYDCYDDAGYRNCNQVSLHKLHNYNLKTLSKRLTENIFVQNYLRSVTNLRLTRTMNRQAPMIWPEHRSKALS